jgi:hypothetical protein
MLACLSLGAAAQVTFTNQTILTGPSPQGIVSGDFNRDGFPDLAVADPVAGSVTILLGVGGGHFSFGQQISTGLLPTQIVSGDFNHDGKLDLAVSLSEADAVAIFLGNGDGTFRQGTSLALDGHPFALVAADFNHAGAADLAVLEKTPGDTFNLKIFRSNGDGTFTRTQSTPLPRKPIFPGLMVSDDFNIDGLPDLGCHGHHDHDLHGFTWWDPAPAFHRSSAQHRVDRRIGRRKTYSWCGPRSGGSRLR